MRKERPILPQLHVSHGNCSYRSVPDGFQTKKGDVTGAFLQSREYPEQLLCIPCDEICEAMGLPPNSLTKVKKACYGLVDAPLEWYRSISAFLAKLGFKKCWSDPCSWILVAEGRLRGIITGRGRFPILRTSR